MPNPRTGRPSRLVAAVLKSQDTWSDAYNALVHEGFDRFAPRRVLQAGLDLQAPALPDGRQLVVRVPRDLEVPIAPGESPVLKYALAASRRDVRRGQSVGRVEVHVRGQRVALLPVYASQDSSLPVLARLESSSGASRARWGVFLLALAGAFALAAARPFRPRPSSRRQRAAR